MTVTAVSPRVAVPARRSYSTAWWGMAIVILTEGMVFVILLAAYFFLRSASKQWPPAGVEVPDLSMSLPFSFVLWGSSLPIFIAEAAIRRDDVRTFRIATLASFLMGASFLAFTIVDFRALHFGWRDNAYGSIYYTIVGLHAIHVVVGLAMSIVVQAKAWLGRYAEGHHASAEVFALYWHFVDVVWLLVFPSLFVSPHLR